MTRRLGIIVGCSGNLAGEFLKGLTLGLWDEEGGKDTAKHEQGEDLHDVVQPRRWIVGRRVTFGSEGSEHDLGNDGADFAGCGGDTVGGGAVACWEAFAGHNEGRGVGSEVEEELAENVERQ